MIRPAFFFAALSCLMGNALLQAADESADQLMSKAHDGRVVWRDFPGFTADIVATADDKSTRGTLDVAADGKLSIKLDSEDGMQWVERTLGSVVGHRLSDDDAVGNLDFADNDAKHPLGRLLKSKDSADTSLWRVQDDVMTEVHRRNDKTHFVISVSEVTRNAEGKHLPHSFVVTTWNNESGAIESSRQVHNEWKRVGAFDLPAKMVAMNSKSDGTRKVEQITLKNVALKAPNGGEVAIAELAPLKSKITSFGAAVAGGYLYTYGGHYGSAHKYTAEDQCKQLMRLNLSKPSEWEVVCEGPGRTGLAMVAYEGKLYRIGGWEAHNKGGEEWDLHSSKDFLRFDPKTGEWTALAELPEGRSSHDAVVIGSKLYVVGGWNMAGDGGGEYLDTAYVCDLATEQPKWEAIAKPPFNRRAIAMGAWNGKVYVIGGMDDGNDTTTEVAVYDPQSNAWSSGPALPGKSMDGFGASAFATKEALFCSATSGGIFRLSDDGSQWLQVGKLSHPRMSHRMVATDDGRLLVVGGTSGRSGKVAEVEAIEVKFAGNAK